MNGPRCTPGSAGPFPGHVHSSGVRGFGRKRIVWVWPLEFFFSRAVYGERPTKAAGEANAPASPYSNRFGTCCAGRPARCGCRNRVSCKRAPPRWSGVGVRGAWLRIIPSLITLFCSRDCGAQVLRKRLRTCRRCLRGGISSARAALAAW